MLGLKLNQVSKKGPQGLMCVLTSIHLIRSLSLDLITRLAFDSILRCNDLITAVNKRLDFSLCSFNPPLTTGIKTLHLYSLSTKSPRREIRGYIWQIALNFTGPSVALLLRRRSNVRAIRLVALILYEILP